ncbi:hypothetical protein DVA67_000650 [Solirubrobacter sp. CPCC 204708]|uniref:Uncharacterized protein n=1 Tax=Solirubrobacter deserti TaxID=2282478 RepID=A0ABT4RM11_9ACTN|nr:hypothetical protein [Solirubrobacter deserti]MBE2314466.1 hypothetical protein [Solirubrobacter deserti]MDA0139613.1 hypothetical protein [Solirubrobacter deserti]
MERIAAIRNPVIRNLEITYAYSLLAAEITARSGAGANWCTYATWASRQAGRTIRGEDAMGYIERRLCIGRSLLHPFRSVGRWMLRKGLFDKSSRVGRVMAPLRTPFDAIELASDAVARGNLKVFAEIGYEFARYLQGGPFAVDAPLLQVAFACYDEAFATDDVKRRAELMLRANLCIGLHEQTRLQPEIGEALDAPYVTAEELGRMLCGTTRRRLAKVVGAVALPAQTLVARFSREVITHSLMVLSLPGRILSLGTHLEDAYPDTLHELVDEELIALVNQYEPVPPALDDCGAEDWSSLEQRMHYIVHLFRVFHLRAEMATAPFTDEQVERFLAGVVPDGDL